MIDILDDIAGVETRRDAFSRAREAGAIQLAEESIAIADDAAREDAAVANLQVRARQWVAERFNRRDLGNQVGAQVNISIGSLLLDAFRQPIPAQAPNAIAGAIVAEAEVLSIDSAMPCELEERITDLVDAAGCGPSTLDQAAGSAGG